MALPADRDALRHADTRYGPQGRQDGREASEPPRLPGRAARPGGRDRSCADARPGLRDRRRRAARSARVPRPHELASDRDRQRRGEVGQQSRFGAVDARSSTPSRNSEASTRSSCFASSSPSRRRSGNGASGSSPFIVAVMGGEEILTATVKQLADRVRPAFNPAAATLGPSFPSGHSATAAAFYATAALLLGRWRGRPARAVLAGLAVGNRRRGRREPRAARRALAVGRDRRPGARLGLVRIVRNRLRRPDPPLRRRRAETAARVADAHEAVEGGSDGRARKPMVSARAPDISN